MTKKQKIKEQIKRTITVKEAPKELTREEMTKALGLNNEDGTMESNTSEEALSKTIDALNFPKNINYATELSEDKIRLLTRLELEGKLFSDKMKKSMSRLLKEMAISLNRKGREENIDIVKAHSMSDFVSKTGGMFGFKNIFNSGKNT